MQNKKYQTGIPLSNNLELMSEWDYEKNILDPLTLTRMSSHKVWWKCHKCGHEWRATIFNRSMGGCKCKGECRKERLSISMTARQLKTEQTCLVRYGVKNTFQYKPFKKKSKETCLKKYGYESVALSNIIKNKKRETCIKRYNVDHPSKTKNFKDKYRNTMLSRYGVENPSKLPFFQEKKIATSIRNNGKRHHFQKEVHLKGDRSEYYKKYNGGFNEALKKKIKSRDNNKCQYPKCSNKTLKLCVHHIDNVKTNNTEENLITLCFSCHSRITVLFPSNIDYYSHFFDYIMLNKSNKK